MNKLFYTELTMGDYKEYAVTLLAGEWSKYRTFSSADEAKRCMATLKHIQQISALAALEQFMRYGSKRFRVDLSSVIKQGTLIVHQVNCLDGTVSLWYAILEGDCIEHVSEVVCDGIGPSFRWKGSNTYASLNAFIRAHYTHGLGRVGRLGSAPKRNGWKECKALVNGKWTKLSVLRLTNTV
jgi:hypothetical protein